MLTSSASYKNLTLEEAGELQHALKESFNATYKAYQELRGAGRQNDEHSIKGQHNAEGPLIVSALADTARALVELDIYAKRAFMPQTQ